MIQKYTDTVIREVRSYYHHITSPRIRPEWKTIKTGRQALNDVPSSTHPHSSAKIAHWNDAIHLWDKVCNPAQRSKVHRCLVQKNNIKRALIEAAKPSEHRAKALKGPQTGQMTHDIKRFTEIVSDTLLTLGGALDLTPNKDRTTGLLQHPPQCTQTTPTAPPLDITWNDFTSYLRSCKPAQAGGSVSISGYLFHLAPEPVKRFLLAVCNIDLNNDMPASWPEAHIILLYKKGPTHDPVNYTPIALLNTLYKIVPTHAARQLYEFSPFYGLIHKTQYGGLPNRRWSDHTLQMLAKYQKCPALYSRYIDFNKAFNSMPHRSLFRTLEHSRLPSSLIRLIRSLYRPPCDYPAVHGHTGASNLQTRGVQQSCPTSPILFVLYVNVLCFPIPHHIDSPPTPHESSHAFIDSLLFCSQSPNCIEEILSFFDTKGRAWGLDINLSKTELHSMGSAPQN